MKKIFCLIIVINFAFAIGLRALIIPQNAILLATSSTGIAYNFNLNPANLYQENNFFSFSSNNWLVDIKGQKVSMLYNTNNGKNPSYLSMESLTDDNIELRGEIPNDTPLGYLGAYWYAVEFGQTLDLKQLNNNINFEFGYKIKINYSKLYTSSMYGYSIDLGMNKQINEYNSIGLVVKNLGKEFSSSIDVEDNIFLNKGTSYGIGLISHIPKIYISLITDVYLQDSTVLKKISIKTELPFFNIYIGQSKSKTYKDIGWGFSVDLSNWMLSYGTIKNDNSALGNPSSIELTRKF